MLVQKLRTGNLQSDRGRFDGTMVYAQHKVTHKDNIYIDMKWKHLHCQQWPDLDLLLSALSDPITVDDIRKRKFTLDTGLLRFWKDAAQFDTLHLKQSKPFQSNYTNDTNP